MLRITKTIQIPDDELLFEFVTASGPGGQNVNKVATAAQLRFDVASSPAVSDAVKRRLLHLAGRRATADGVIVIDARRFRTQRQNREDALGRLATLVRQATIVPKRRVKTKPTAASKRRRLDSKRQRGDIKKQRGKLPDE